VDEHAKPGFTPPLHAGVVPGYGFGLGERELLNQEKNCSKNKEPVSGFHWIGF